jgi:hypothetical protein
MKRPQGTREGLVLWRGPSLIDGAPIVLIATGFNKRGGDSNSKTGDVVQTWILRDDVSPIDALNSGADVSVCGSCPLRPMVATGASYHGRACYVHIGFVDNIYRALTDGLYASIDELAHEWTDELAGRVVRIGSYGDPAAVPSWVWREVTSRARSWVGYTHAWRTCDRELRKYVMASCDSPEERSQALLQGWRTFRTRFPEETLGELEIMCPASAEGGKRTTCEKCRLCNGSRSADDDRKDIAVVVHGWAPAVAAYHRVRESLRILGGAA